MNNKECEKCFFRQMMAKYFDIHFDCLDCLNETCEEKNKCESEVEE